MTTFWGLHMAEIEASQPVEEEFVAIGWNDMGDLRQLPPDREAYKRKLAEVYPSEKPGAVPVKAGVLFQFAVEMQPGDHVVYPSKPDRMVNIGRIVGDYEYLPAEGAGYAHRRAVKWLKHVPRTEFSQSALYEIGSAVTLFQVATHVDEFKAALADAPIPAAEMDEVTAGDVSQQVEESTEDFILKRLKSAVTPHQFEEFTAHLLECMGYHARVTQRSRDGGVDVVAHRDELGFEPPIIKVQCKQQTDVVGRPDVQKLDGAVQAGEYGLFITLGSYSADARNYEMMKPNLRLIEGTELAELVMSHYESFSPRWQAILPLRRVYVPSAKGTDATSAV